MNCPHCNSENYHYIETVDFDETGTALHFKCLGKCGQDFYGIYPFSHFEDEDGNEICGD